MADFMNQLTEEILVLNIWYFENMIHIRKFTVVHIFG